MSTTLQCILLIVDLIVVSSYKDTTQRNFKFTNLNHEYANVDKSNDIIYPRGVGKNIYSDNNYFKIFVVSNNEPKVGTDYDSISLVNSLEKNNKAQNANQKLEAKDMKNVEKKTPDNDTIIFIVKQSSHPHNRRSLNAFIDTLNGIGRKLSGYHIKEYNIKYETPDVKVNLVGDVTKKKKGKTKKWEQYESSCDSSEEDVKKDKHVKGHEMHTGPKGDYSDSKGVYIGEGHIKVNGHKVANITDNENVSITNNAYTVKEFDSTLWNKPGKYKIKDIDGEVSGDIYINNRGQNNFYSGKNKYQNSDKLDQSKLPCCEDEWR